MAGASTAADRPASPSVQRSIGWGVAGSLGYAFCQWGVLVALARSGNAEWVGTFAYALAVSSPVVMATNMQLGWLQATDGGNRFTFGDYWLHRLCFSTAALLVVIGIAFARGDGVIGPVIVLVGLAKMFEAWSDIHHGRFQRWHRLDLMARSQMLRGAGAVLSVALLGRVTHRLWVAVLGMGLAWGVVWAAHDRRTGPGRNGAIGGRRSLADLTTQAYPLGVAAALSSFNAAVPRLVIGHSAGTHTLGIFSAIAYLAVGARMVAVPFGQAIAPWLGESHVSGDRAAFGRRLRQLGLVAVVLGLVGVLGAAWVGRPFLEAVYGPEYGAHEGALIVVMSAGAVSCLSLFLQIGATAARRIGAQVVIVSLSILTTAVVAAATVGSDPVRGGALALAAGAVVELAGTSVLLLSGRPVEDRR